MTLWQFTAAIEGYDKFHFPKSEEDSTEAPSDEAYWAMVKKYSDD